MLFWRDIQTNYFSSSSSVLEAVASWSDKGWHCHLVLVGGVGMSLNLWVGRLLTAVSLPTVASCGVVASMVASGTLPVRSSQGYISALWALVGQAHKAALQASTNVWQSYPSSTSALHSSLSTLSLSWDCSKLWVWVEQWVSASLIATL